MLFLFCDSVLWKTDLWQIIFEKLVCFAEECFQDKPENLKSRKAIIISGKYNLSYHKNLLLGLKRQKKIY